MVDGGIHDGVDSSCGCLPLNTGHDIRSKTFCTIHLSIDTSQSDFNFIFKNIHTRVTNNFLSNFKSNLNHEKYYLGYSIMNSRYMGYSTNYSSIF